MADLTEKMIALSTITEIEKEQVDIIKSIGVIDTITKDNTHEFINRNRLKPLEIFETCV